MNKDSAEYLASRISSSLYDLGQIGEQMDLCLDNGSVCEIDELLPEIDFEVRCLQNLIANYREKYV
ncbi:MAG: hypothetical protein QE271_08115 [Bacteriovoracaceae bacterium]|nr:hypothetical protein [Bacteriovoracaceae bacterium]